MKFSEIAAGDAVTSALVAKVLEYSPLLRNHVEFYKGSGLATQERKEQAGVKTLAGRALNSDALIDVQNPATFNVNRKIFSGGVKVDVAYENFKVDVPVEMTAQLQRRGSDIADTFHGLFINGDSVKANAIEFDGLNTIAKATANKVVAGANGLSIEVGNADSVKKSHDKFMEAMYNVLAQCKGVNKLIVLGAALESRINTIARNHIQYTTDTFGKRIGLFDGIPFLNIEANGDKIIADEKVGTATGCTSLYVVSLEEAAGLSFWTADNGFQVFGMEKVGSSYQHEIQFIADTALFRDKAVAKLEGLILA